MFLHTVPYSLIQIYRNINVAESWSIYYKKHTVTGKFEVFRICLDLKCNKKEVKFSNQFTRKLFVIIEKILLSIN